MELGNMLFGNSRGEYPVDRAEYQDSFHEFLERINCDGYGFYDGPADIENKRGGITTDIVEINPYWWGDEDDYEECEKPNFWYKPLDIKVDWYKYPVRDSYSNIPLESIDMNAIFAHIIEHIAELEGEKQK